MFSARLPGQLEPNGFSRALARARASGRLLLDLTETNPTRVGIPYPPALISALADPAAAAYAPEPRGLLSARAAIAKKGPGRFFDQAAKNRPGPFFPVLGVGAVIVTDDLRVVLVKRRHEPLAGQWSLPGGKLELGETLEAGIAREVREETGLIVDVGPLIEVFDRILLDADGRVQHHFVLVDYLCRVRGGQLAAGSDVVDVALANDDELPGFRLTDKALAVARQGLALAIQ